ncbi:transposase, partial [Chloroflexota bacterium]
QADRLPVVVINPHQVRDFARATSVLAKTDTIDARILALFGAWVKPEIRPLPDKNARDMRSLLTRRRQLVEMLASEHNRLFQTHEDIRLGVEAHIKWLGRLSPISMAIWSVVSSVALRGLRRTTSQECARGREGGVIHYSN